MYLGALAIKCGSGSNFHSGYLAQLQVWALQVASRQMHNTPPWKPPAGMTAYYLSETTRPEQLRKQAGGIYSS